MCTNISVLNNGIILSNSLLNYLWICSFFFISFYLYRFEEFLKLCVFIYRIVSHLFNGYSNWYIFAICNVQCESDVQMHTSSQHAPRYLQQSFSMMMMNSDKFYRQFIYIYIHSFLDIVVDMQWNTELLEEVAK